jgi:hypothetical protein
MIDTILDVIFWILEALVGLLPEWTPPFVDDLQSLMNWLAQINDYFPVVELGQCIVAYFGFVAVLMVARPFLKWGRLA